MKTIKLKAKTDLGQNKLFKYGQKWVVMDERKNVDYLAEPGWFQYVRPVQSVKNRYGLGAFWLKKPFDINFEIEVS